MIEGDVLIFNDNDGGNIRIKDGLMEMTGGLASAAYLSLFGGNAEDNGLENTENLSFWGNLLENNTAFFYTSRTQYFLQGNPATSNNLRLLEREALSDLQWLIDQNIANNIEIEVSIPQVGKVLIEGTIQAEGKEEQFSFTENWQSMREES